MRRYIGGVALALVISLPAQALDVLSNGVMRTDDGRYHFDFDLLIEAPIDPVRALMTDYPRLARLSDLVVESAVTEATATAPLRLSMNLRGCVLLYCKVVRKVEDIESDSNGDILTHAVPGAGDFSFSEERWSIRPDTRGTRLRYVGVMAPTFFVPPLIGPPILKYSMRKELISFARRVEQLATAP